MQPAAVEARGYRWDTEWLDDPVYGLSLLSTQSTADAEELTPVLSGKQLYILRSIAIAAACISVISGLLVGWWFVRMKRSFRHHLIMLLIFSDFFKASWQLIYPAYVFARGEVRSESLFCQTAGFMMSMGIEASDFAVLVIAVHSALYIFRPGMGVIGEGGLFQYRYYVYAAWVAFAIMMPSLAFLNNNPAYTAQGTFCYLPVRPFWYRLTLTWIPRYIIVFVILILYASIYIYVRTKFRTFRTSAEGGSIDVDTIDLVPPEPLDEIPRLPSLDVHGLIPPSSAAGSRRPSNIGDQPFPKALLPPFIDRTNLSSSCGSHNGDSRRGSFPTLFAMTGSTTDQAISNKKRLFNDTANAETRSRRISISRQLRLLFIYPLVYTLMWVPPLVSNAMEFTEKYVHRPSFFLHCVVAFTIPFQCFVDCWLFTIREKPWRYIPETQRGNWMTRYGFGVGNCAGNSADIGAEDGGDEGWRTRKHMSFEARKAYERREEEKKEAEEEWLARDAVGRKRRDMAWWDAHERHLEQDYDDESIVESEADELSRIENGEGSATQ